MEVRSRWLVDKANITKVLTAPLRVQRLHKDTSRGALNTCLTQTHTQHHSNTHTRTETHHKHVWILRDCNPKTPVQHTHQTNMDFHGWQTKLTWGNTENESETSRAF